jgi:hypothetical protein
MAQPLAHLGHGGLAAQHQLDPSHRHAHFADAQPGQRRAEVLEEMALEPGAVLPLQRELLVAEQDGQRH